MFKQLDDAFVVFRCVRVISATARTLFCAIGDKRVWIAREHIKGRLRSRGDRGTLQVRRWVAVDRHLVGVPEVTSLGRSELSHDRLRLLRSPASMALRTRLVPGV